MNWSRQGSGLAVPSSQMLPRPRKKGKSKLYVPSRVRQQHERAAAGGGELASPAAAAAAQSMDHCMQPRLPGVLTARPPP